MTASKIFLYFCLSFILGIFVNSFFNISLVSMLIVLILAILLISVLWKYKKAAVIGFCLIFLVMGIWRHQQAELRITNNELKEYNDSEEKITLIGTITKEPDIRDNNTRLTLTVKEIQPYGPFHRTKEILDNSRVLVTTRRYPEYQYGDELKITGKLETPKTFEDFNYKDYLAKDGIYSVMHLPEIELLCSEFYRDPTSATCRGRVSVISVVYGKILEFKNKLRESIEQNLSPPQSSILGAMILGDKRKISAQWKQKLNIAGVRHITCISGMHIVILSGILMWLGITLGLWRGQAFYFAIIFITIFIIMVGAPPSAIRAGIMAGLFLFAQKIGRLKSGSRAITFAATFMLVQNPLLLRFDVGFQLSFLATLGMIHLIPVFQNWLGKIPNPEIFSLRGIISMTLAAQVFTLPILIYNFGYMSLVSPITNILIVPLLPFVMISGFIFGIAGIIWQPLGWILSLPCWLLLTYIIKVVDWFFQIPFASLFFRISWFWVLISYLILSYITWRLTQKQKLRFLEY